LPPRNAPTHENSWQGTSRIATGRAELSFGSFPMHHGQRHGLPTPTIRMIVHSITGDNVATNSSLLHRSRPRGSFHPPNMLRRACDGLSCTPPWCATRCAQKGGDPSSTNHRATRGSSTKEHTGEALPPRNKCSFLHGTSLFRDSSATHIIMHLQMVTQIPFNTGTDPTH